LRASLYPDKVSTEPVGPEEGLNEFPASTLTSIPVEEEEHEPKKVRKPLLLEFSVNRLECHRDEGRRWLATLRIANGSRVAVARMKPR
jgi:hypothetical protein